MLESHPRISVVGGAFVLGRAAFRHRAQCVGPDKGSVCMLSLLPNVLISRTLLRYRRILELPGTGFCGDGPALRSAESCSVR
jgi:hypothetical protein